MAATKTMYWNKSQALAHLNDFFKQFQHWIKQAKEPTLAEIEKFFTSDFQLSSNGILISRDLSDHLNRLNKLRKKYARIEVEGPFEEPLVCDNQLAVHYALHLSSHTGEKKEVGIIALAVIEDNKFKRWTQVAHEKGKDWSS